MSTNVPNPSEEIFREQIPWLDESLVLVGTRAGEVVRLDLTRKTPISDFPNLEGLEGLEGVKELETRIHMVCTFRDGKIKFIKDKILISGNYMSKADNITRTGSKFIDISDSEKLCLSVMPHGYDPTKMPDLMKDPIWQRIIDHMKIEHVMAS